MKLSAINFVWHIIFAHCVISTHYASGSDCDKQLSELVGEGPLRELSHKLWHTSVYHPALRTTASSSHSSTSLSHKILKLNQYFADFWERFRNKTHKRNSSASVKNKSISSLSDAFVARVFEMIQWSSRPVHGFCSINELPPCPAVQ